MAKVHEVETPEEWQAVFDGVSEQFNSLDYTDVLTEFLPTLEETHLAYFDSQAGPEGAWPKLAPSTVRRKGHDTILFDTGRLKASLGGASGDSIRDVFREGGGNQHALIFGTAVPYSNPHMVGGPFLPVRKHVGMTEETAAELDGDVADWTVEGLKDSD